jgi:hypothetical protein
VADTCRIQAVFGPDEILDCTLPAGHAPGHSWAGVQARRATAPDADRAGEELAAWRAATDAATDGPWEPVTDEHGRKGIEHAVWAPAAARYAAEFMFWRPDAAFTAAARTAMPRLLAAVEAVLAMTADSGEPDLDWDGNPEHFMIRVVRCDEIRAAIERELTGDSVA